ncbi:MAG: PspC domain-containing protein, partial [Frankiaceae bacterium]|nr:PspC domain-containing protein [Frankiaceae bacterium]
MTASTTTPVSDATATTPISAAPVAPEAVGSSGPHRWVGGVASGVAGRTRIPVTVLRVGWVGAVAICSSTGKSTLAWVPVVCYLACWWTLAKRRRPVETSAAAPMTTPAQRPAAPAAAAPTHEPTTTPAAKPTATLPAAEATATVPTTPAVDDTPQLARLKDFVRYVWGTQPTPQPTYTADLCGVVLTGLQIPGRRDIGYYAPRLPFGKLYVYPNYLVFLSESHNKPGVVPSAGRLVSVLLDAWRVIGFWRPIPLARQVYRSVTTDELDRLRKPLGNPNSIVVRRSD